MKSFLIRLGFIFMSIIMVLSYAFGMCCEFFIWIFNGKEMDDYIVDRFTKPFFMYCDKYAKHLNFS